jgi:pilus assembly protein CpaB
MKLSTAAKSFKPNKTWVVLGVALGIGLLAALAASNYLSNRMAAIDAKSRGETVDIVVAKADLPKGTKLTSETMAVRKVPRDYAHSAAVTPNQFDRVDNQILAYPVKAGEMIIWGLIEGKKVPTFSARVENGRRAMTVPVDEINSISGLLEPGDIIDLMVTMEQKGKNQKSKKITFPLLQSVQVIATGQRSVDDPKSGERRQYSTVTLDTSPADANRVIVARETGKITALLRNPQDKAPLANTGRDIDKLLGLKDGDQLADGEKTLLEVPVLYGGRGSKFPPEGLLLGQYIQTKVTLTPNPQAADTSKQPNAAAIAAEAEAALAAVSKALPTPVPVITGANPNPANATNQR